jgi:hypothetical protein
VADSGHATGPVGVEFPDEFDFGSAGDVAVRLRAAIAAGVSVVVADLTTAAFAAPAVCASCSWPVTGPAPAMPGCGWRSGR